MIFLVASALAASLDQLDVGGPWGTPTSSDATAVWWNPAGLAMESGHRYQLEAAPILGGMDFERADPHGGADRYVARAVLPYVGVASDLGVEGLGVGFALAVPTARGGLSEVEDGPGRYSMRGGEIKALYGLAAVGFRPVPQLAVGASVALVQSGFVGSFDQDLLPDLAHAIEETSGSHPYTDEDLEDPEYSATMNVDLADVAMTGGASVLVRPHPMVDIGITYLHGVRVVNEGQAQLAFQCPPQGDSLGRFASESRGICDTDILANASIGYALPPRLHGGLTVRPMPQLRVELMGGWVGWARHDQMRIEIADTGELNPDLPEDGPEAIDRVTPQARGNVNSGWGGVDVKVMPTPRWVLGARALYDSSAVPDASINPSNADADELVLSGLVAFAPYPSLQLGLSFTEHLSKPRVVDSNALYSSIEDPPEEAYAYPHANGTYTLFTHRVGVAVRGSF